MSHDINARIFQDDSLKPRPPAEARDHLDEVSLWILEALAEGPSGEATVFDLVRRWDGEGRDREKLSLSNALRRFIYLSYPGRHLVDVDRRSNSVSLTEIGRAVAEVGKAQPEAA